MAEMAGDLNEKETKKKKEEEEEEEEEELKVEGGEDDAMFSGGISKQCFQLS